MKRNRDGKSQWQAKIYQLTRLPLNRLCSAPSSNHTTNKNEGGIVRKSASQRRIRTSICLGVLALTAASSLCQADSDLWTGEYSLKGKWEVYAGGQYLSGDTANFSDTGSLLKLDAAFTGGVGFGYHFLD
jgi:hypothetical protein